MDYDRILLYYAPFPTKLFGKAAFDGNFLHQLVADACPPTLLTRGRLFILISCD